MIELSSVTKRYFKTAIDDLSFSFPPGKVIGIIGENGSGKSTLLKLIAGLIHPTKGTVTINGDKVDRLTGSKYVSYLSELNELYPFYTVDETLTFFASQFSDFNLEKANEIVQFMNLNVDEKVKHLSKGGRARLKIVLALSRDVPIILMDEPLSGLDPLVRESVIKSLISFVDMENQTVLVTTHELNEIEPLLDYVVVIKEGEIAGFKDVEAIRYDEGISLADWLKKIYNT